jgi:predicted DCC family thiol-disulfide oxidoreductase YuxK
MSENAVHNPIVFYDGDCGFCNSSVQFILNKRKKAFYFLPLQSERAKELLNQFGVEIKLDTIYYLNNQKLYTRSSAALQICKGLKGGYPLLFGFYVIPKFLRDPFYNFIAARRHKLRQGYCMIPKPEEQHFFLKQL